MRFLVTLLGTLIDKRRTLALLILSYGMVLVQTPTNGTEAVIDSEKTKMNGLLCIFLANLTSGFAGAFLEKIYKSKSSTSVWEKNMQLACFSVPFAFFAALTKDHETFRRNGFFSGYNAVVMAVVALQAAGGLIVAIVMRYSSTILKCFAVSLSICICAVVSAVSENETLDAHIVNGIVLVNLATALYGTHRNNDKPGTLPFRKIARDA